MAKAPTIKTTSTAKPASAPTSAKKTQQTEAAPATPRAKRTKPASATAEPVSKSKAKPKIAVATEKPIEERWGKDLTASGWTAIPNALFVYSQELGIDSLDIVIILHLAKFWWRKGNDPHPSKKTLAKMIGVDARTIQRRIANLESKHYIQRTERKSVAHGGNTSNSYSFTGLIKAAKPYAKQLLEVREEKAAEIEPSKSRKPAIKSAR
ncbi:helix-turn-helix domain-containing protein [Pseudomonas frederiksbergensis]|uniref:helix-turn-helix domain-containing protein n=1 Tax=Pseudomonas cucumis TaxID=2954082 RepID=UPI0021865CC2|nr:helix-turn-helix domain-containing protein [Pseudomonas cucumis]URM27143.1 helix-turn-helix domain-containing protein [Pseudomonas frederiksbergensis]WLG92435.1 helix-turn-helix domain-containing protein [Pseudomonas cucumis]